MITFQLAVHLPDAPPGVPRTLRKLVTWPVVPRMGEDVYFGSACLQVNMIIHDNCGRTRVHALQNEVAQVVGLDPNDLISFANELAQEYGFDADTDWEIQDRQVVGSQR